MQVCARRGAPGWRPRGRPSETGADPGAAPEEARPAAKDPVRVVAPWRRSVWSRPAASLLISALILMVIRSAAAPAGTPVAAPAPRLTLQVGHGDSITCLAFRRDGRMLITGSRDHTARVWVRDPDRGRTGWVVLATLAGHRALVWSAAISPDGRWAATCSEDGSAALWDPRTGERRFSLRGHQGPVRGVGFPGGGQYLATWGLDRTLRLWKLGTGLPGPQLTPHETAISATAFSPRDGLFASASRDGDVRIWRGGPDVIRLPARLPGACVLAFAPDGRTLAIGSTLGGQSRVELWSLGGSTKPGAPAPPPAGVGRTAPPSAATTRRTSRRARSSPTAASARKRLARTPTTAPSALGRSGHSAGRSPISAQPGPARARPASRPAPVVSRLRRLAGLHGPAGGLAQLVFSPDGRRLAAGGGTGAASRAIVWDLRALEGHAPPGGDGDGNQTILGRLSLTGPIGQLVGLSFSPDGEILAVGSDDGEIRLWDTHLPFVPGSERTRSVIRQSGGSAGALAFAPNGEVLAAGAGSPAVSVPGDLRIWQVGQNTAASAGSGRAFSLTLLPTPPPPLRPVQALVSPDGRVIATWGEDGVARLWDRETGELKSVIPRVRPPLEFVPGGDAVRLGGVLATGGDSVDRAAGNQAGSQSELTLWQCRSPAGWGRPLATFRHRAPVSEVAFSQDGRILSTADEQGAIRVWVAPVLDSAPGATWKLKLHAAPEGSVSALAFSPDGRTLVTAGGGLDLTTGSAVPFSAVRLWDVERARLRATLPGSVGAWPSLTFSPDGSLLAVGADRIVANRPAGGEIKLWDVRTTGLRGRLYSQQLTVTGCRFSPDGRTLATRGRGESAVWLWSAETLSHMGILEGHASEVVALAFSSDGQVLCSRDRDGEVLWWDVLGQRRIPAPADYSAFPAAMRLPVEITDAGVALRDAVTGRRRVTFCAVPGGSPETEGRRWLTHAEEGWLDGSPDFGPLIRWNVAGALARVDRYWDRYHRPGRLREALRDETSHAAPRAPSGRPPGAEGAPKRKSLKPKPP